MTGNAFLAAIAKLPSSTLLRLGDVSPTVVLLKRALGVHGYGPAPWRNPESKPAQLFDEQVRLAVKQFQRDKRLELDGVVGPQTLQALGKTPAAMPPLDPLQPLRAAAAQAAGRGWERGLAVALQAEKLHIHETGGNNRGPTVEAIQSFAGGKAGDAWCAAFCDVCMRLGFSAAGDKLPISIGLSCSRLVKRATKAGRVFELAGFSRQQFPDGQPALGDLIVLRGGRTGYKHIGIVRSKPDAKGKVQTVEGNTNDAGSAEGDGVYLKQRNLYRTPCVFVRLR